MCIRSEYRVFACTQRMTSKMIIKTIRDRAEHRSGESTATMRIDRASVPVVDARLSSEYPGGYGASHCIDHRRSGGLCVSQLEAKAWLSVRVLPLTRVCVVARRCPPMWRSGRAQCARPSDRATCVSLRLEAWRCRAAAARGETTTTMVNLGDWLKTTVTTAAAAPSMPANGALARPSDDTRSHILYRDTRTAYRSGPTRTSRTQVVDRTPSSRG